MSFFDIIALDADDTLWHNESLFSNAHAMFRGLLAQYLSPELIAERLHQTEMRNIQHFGYGIKAFALSMIETALELTEGRVKAGDIQALIDYAKGMLVAEVELLEHVSETIPLLAQSHRLMVITKGDPLDQESKLARSGLQSYFWQVEVVSDKNPAVYQNLLNKYNLKSQRFMMVGNSQRSDILPVLEIGGAAVFVPYLNTWVHEAADAPPPGQPRYYEIEHLGHLPGLLARLEAPRSTAARNDR
ncbi:MAG TPA: HAD family hydrolase [Anaerolineales bacterium]|nr:HAD family hydrolase [Anaerolineales bacterium]